MVFVTKYRKPILSGGIDEDIKQIIFEISKMDDSLFAIDTMETETDHIHILVDIDPTISASSIVSRIKQMSTNRIWQNHSVELKKNYWKENTFWSDGYFVCSTGDASLETIRKYIEEQG
jgi:putative transposase